MVDKVNPLRVGGIHFFFYISRLRPNEVDNFLFHSNRLDLFEEGLISLGGYRQTALQTVYL